MRPLARAAGLGLPVAMMLTVYTPGAAAEVATARVVGTLARYPVEVMQAYDVDRSLDASTEERQGQLIVIDELRLLAQLFTAKVQAATVTVVLFRDLDTLRPQRVVEIAGDTRGMTSERIHAVDLRRARMFLLGGSAVQQIDLRSWAVSTIPFPPSGVLSPQGLAYDDRTDRLYVTNAGPENSGIPGTLVALQATPAPGEDPLLYIRPLRSCRGPTFLSLSPTDPRWTVPLLSLKDHLGVWRLHIPCLLRSSVGGVVAVAADDPNDTTEQVVVGPPQTFSVLGDPNGRRVMLVHGTSNGSRVGAVYDAPSAAFVGVVTLRGPGQEPFALGADPRTGTLYGLSRSLQFFTSALRLDPVPQPTTLEGFTAMGRARVWTDPATDRAFVLPMKQNKDQNWVAARRFTVLRVPRPQSPPDPLDPDRFTTQVREEEGITSASYAGTGSGYGGRILLARGVQGIPPAGESIASIQPGSFVMSAAPNKCGFVDRMLALGAVGTSTLSDTSAGGRAAEIDVDASTKVDLGQPSRCDMSGLASLFAPDRLGGLDVGGSTAPATIDSLAGRDWGYRSAECASSDDEKTSERDEDAPSFGSAEISCAFGQQKLEASARGRIDVPGLEVLSSHSIVTITRAIGEGITVRSEAVANGIRMGEITIGRVRSIATSTAGGNRGTASASFVRELTGVSAPGLPDSLPRSCQNQGCEELLARINVALSGRAEFRFPIPDQELCRDRDPASGTCIGTPGGAQAGILKSVFRRASDNSMSGDSSWELPGLELLVYNDNSDTGRARQLIQFAGVRADTTYNISLIPTGSGFPPPPPAPLRTDPVHTGETTVAPPPILKGTQQAPGPLQRLVRPVAEGLRFLFASPTQALRTASVWLLLLGPIGMAARRRRLASLDG